MLPSRWAKKLRTRWLFSFLLLVLPLMSLYRWHQTDVTLYRKGHSVTVQDMSECKIFLTVGDTLYIVCQYTGHNTGDFSALDMLLHSRCTIHGHLQNSKYDYITIQEILEYWRCQFRQCHFTEDETIQKSLCRTCNYTRDYKRSRYLYTAECIFQKMSLYKITK